MTDPIKAKIQELCPDVLIRTVRVTKGKKTVEEIDLLKDFTLAVVLRAIQKAKGGMWFRQQRVEVDQWVADLISLWDLTKDYDQQSEETKLFIGKLLGV